MSAVLDEAYERLHTTGPEWGGNLANHGPMAAEVLARRGHGADVHRWVDAYLRRLDELPAAGEVITEQTWQQALGNGRVGDWTAYLTREAELRPWRELLVTWWPRLLPGIAAGATHGVIRVGHVVRNLLDSDADDPVADTELAHALAYWAARSRTVPGVLAPAGGLGPAEALDAVPHLAEQHGPIAGRLDRLAGLDGWPGSVAALRPAADPDEVLTRLDELISAATLRYLDYGHGSPVLLVHTATAPNAVLHILPALPTGFWAPSLSAAWAASAAITSTYAPAEPMPRDERPDPPAGPDAVHDLVERAVAHGDEHVIKFADTAADVYQRTADPDALAAAVHASGLLSR
jgi:hypothetical protein